MTKELADILVIETYPFERQPKLNKKRIMALYDSLSYMDQQQNVIYDHPTAALIDRLTENSHVINMKGCRTLRQPLNAEPCAEP
jgi:hypothetical protein